MQLDKKPVVGIPTELTLYHPAEFLQLAKVTLAFLNIFLEEYKGGVTNQLLVGHIVGYIQQNGLDPFKGSERYKDVYMEDLLRQALDKGIDLKNLTEVNYRLNWKQLNQLSDNVSIYQSKDPFAKATNVFSSSNYRMFHHLPFNRNRSKRHSRAIADSMRRNGITSHPLMIYTNVVDGEWKYWIVDGQHRTDAFEIIGHPVHFTLYQKQGGGEITIYDLVQLVADVNNNSKKWDLRQYLKAWSYLKVREYEKIDEVHKNTKITITTLLQAYSGLNRKSATTLFTNGKYRMSDESNGDMYVDYLTDLKPVLPKSTALYTGLLEFFKKTPDYDNAQMITAIKKSKTPVFFGDTQEEILENIQIMYMAA